MLYRELSLLGVKEQHKISLKKVHELPSQVSVRTASCRDKGCRRETLPSFKLQTVPNAAARLVLKLPRRTSISAHLRKLHWLPVQKRILFKALVLMHRALKPPGPEYLSSRIQCYIPIRSLRSSHGHLVNVPRVRRAKTGGRTFSLLGPLAWNRLPAEVRHIGS